ncbi:MAG TPA: DoxX family protein [Gemmatimonadales bacterium]
MPDLRGPRTGTGLLILRVTLGVLFFAHGYQKLVTIGLPEMQVGFMKYHIPFPGVAAIFVTFLELLGGAALVLGLFTRILGLLFAVEMLVAIFAVHITHGLVGPGSVELPLIFCAASAVLALSGAGIASLDRRIGRGRVRVGTLPW